MHLGDCKQCLLKSDVSGWLRFLALCCSVGSSSWCSLKEALVFSGKCFFDAGGGGILFLFCIVNFCTLEVKENTWC